MHGAARALGLNALTPLSKHKAFNQCCFNVGQRRRRWPNIETYWVNACVCWKDCITSLQIRRNTMQSSHLPRKHKVVHHHLSVSRDLYLCIYGDTVMLLCLYNILPPFSVYVKSTTSSSWGIFFFC